MRTTIRIDDALMAELKQLAASTGRTLTAVIETCLREALGRRQHERRGPVKLPVYHGTGLQAGIDLSDSASILDHMEGRDGPS